MSLESFYGGRMGASFVIVERFDGINIPQEEGSKVYAARYLAVTNDEAFYIYETDHFIQRNMSIRNIQITDSLPMAIQDTHMSITL